MIKTLSVITGVFFIILSFQNCAAPMVSFEEIPLEVQKELEVTPETEIICDPFHQVSDTCDRGFIGDIYTLAPELANLEENKKLQRYFEIGKRVNQENVKLVFPEIVFPTQLYTHGFKYGSDYLRTDGGEKLFEFFALDLKGVVQLMANQSEGFYQFAIISDDGSRLSIVNEDGTHSMVLGHEGWRATQMSCASQAIFMTKDKLLPLSLQYYQGPRTAISFALIWRKVDTLDISSANDKKALKYCDVVDSQFFGDFESDPVARMEPQEGTKWADLHAMGWKKVEKNNLYQFTKK